MLLKQQTLKYQLNYLTEELLNPSLDYRGVSIVSATLALWDRTVSWVSVTTVGQDSGGR